MSTVTRDVAQTEADTIKNETVPGANTATRVGGTIRDLADSVAFSTQVEIGSASERGYTSYQASADVLPARVVAKKSRGTPTAPANTVAGDGIAEFVARQRTSGFDIDGGLMRFVRWDSSGRVSFELWLHDLFQLTKVSTTVVARATTSTAAAVGVINVDMTNNNSIMSFAARWRGIDAAGNMVFLEQTFVMRRIGSAAPTQYGSTNNVFPILKDDAACGTPDFSVSSNTVAFRVTGKASTNYTWDVEVTYRELY